MIPFTGLKREYSSLKPEIDAAVERVLASGEFILESEVENFEKEFATYHSVTHGIGVNSGTDALFLSLKAADIGEGDEVIVPVNTALPTAMAVVMSGAHPVFVDCDTSLLMDIAAVPEAITPKTKAIIAVHLYGLALDIDSLANIAREHGIVLIEDCAQATGAEWNGKKVGSVGDFGAFSFYPTKNLGGYGDGGMILTNNKDFEEKLRALRFYGQRDRIHCTVPGVNSRLDALQAAILSAKMKYLDDWNQRRRDIARQYTQLLGDTYYAIPDISSGLRHVYHLFVVRLPERDRLREHLKTRGIATMVHYPIPLNKQPLFAADNDPRGFPVAQAAASEIVSIPLHPFLSDEEITLIAHELRNFSSL